LVSGCDNQQAGSADVDRDNVLTDDSLLSLVQRQTFQYFWQGAEPVSGMAPERIHIDGVYPQNDRDVVTVGGGGFGLMARLVRIERGFISKQAGPDRLLRMLDFRGEAARFHGAWPHWLLGPTGKTRSFSDRDDGGDLVETAF